MGDITPSSQLPSWIAKYAKVGFDTDDVAALIRSIDSSQNAQSPLAQLPAELLLHVLEYVPIDHVLDWRLVCRGFRDAIDGRILYHHLQRTQLVGVTGARSEWPMKSLSEDQYDRIQFVNAHFQKVQCDGTQGSDKRPVWTGTHAVFTIEDTWFHAFPNNDATDDLYADTIEYAETVWSHALPRLELARPDAGFGTLRWCIKLDHAVLDLDFPLEPGRNNFNLSVDLQKRTIKVAWKDMLFSFLKTEGALRRMLDQKVDCDFTYNLVEDCLRHVRRQRLHSALDLDNKVDRHLKWTLRLLRPLFAKRGHNDTSTLQVTEENAINALLLLRREAAMTLRQIAELHQLKADLQTMEREMDDLDENYDKFRAHMFPNQNLTCVVSRQPDIPYNPIAWPDELRAIVQGQVSKWYSQKKIMKQISALLCSSNQALAVPEDSFDDLASEV